MKKIVWAMFALFCITNACTTVYAYMVLPSEMRVLAIIVVACYSMFAILVLKNKLLNKE